MNLLKAAAVDISLLVITARALRTSPGAESNGRHKLRTQWSRELRRAAAAYQVMLWRHDEIGFDAAALKRCRRSAEHEMPLALQSRDEIGALLSHQADALAGYASARNDLWRLAHVIVNLRGVRRRLARGDASRLVTPRRSPGRRLQRRLRRAMTDYTRALLRDTGRDGSPIRAARQAASEHLDERCLRCATELAQADLAGGTIDDSVIRPLHAIAEDWTIE